MVSGRRSSPFSVISIHGRDCGVWGAEFCLIVPDAHLAELLYLNAGRQRRGRLVTHDGCCLEPPLSADGFVCSSLPLLAGGREGGEGGSVLPWKL